MWARVVVFLFLVPPCRVQYLEEEFEEYKNADFYDNYEETEATAPVLTTTAMEPYTRVRRYGNPNRKRTLNPKELQDVKGVLREIFANRRLEAGAAAEITSSYSLSDTSRQSSPTFDQSYTPSHQSENLYNQSYHSYDQSQKTSTFKNKAMDTFIDKEMKNIKEILHQVSSSTYTPYPYDWISTEKEFSSVDPSEEERSVLKEAVKRLNRRVEIWEPQDATNKILTTLLEYLDNSTERTLNPSEIKAVDDALKRFISSQKMIVTRSSLRPSNNTRNEEYLEAGQSTEAGWETLISTVTELYEMTESDGDEYAEDDEVTDAALRMNTEKKKKVFHPLIKKIKKRRKKKKKKPTPLPSGMVINGKWHTFPPGWPYDLTSCPTTDTTPYKLDIRGMLKLLANLTYEYDMNLVERFNESMYEYSIPTCPSHRYYGTYPGGAPILEEQTTPLDFDNTTVVAKCFVCGLKSTHIPKDAYCADAFAGDFLPLVAVDPRARGHIARYRKYCRYIDSRDPIELPMQPRAVYGRFSGGCSVRWTDLSGVYTQRTCRSKRRAVTGNHFGSKRMAKLEMALNHLDNGCIISPMATLLPLSRGISLYARFHACVCTGAWCNRTLQDAPWLTNILICFWLYSIWKNN